MKLKLVYFDDQIQNIECFKLLLEEKFEVVGCLDARLYREVLRDHHPHVFLLDVHMPYFHGHELYKLITEDPAYNGCPVIFISGDVSGKTKISSLESGGIDFFSRDMSPEEIEGRLKSKIRLYFTTAGKIKVGNLIMDFPSQKVNVGGRDVGLTMVEMRVLGSVLRSVPGGISRQNLLEAVWRDDKVKPGTINTNVSLLMSKLSQWDHVIQIKKENIVINES